MCRYCFVMPNETKVCEVCGVEFFVILKRRKQANRFCSRACYYIAQKGNKKDKKTPHNRHIYLTITDEQGNRQRIYEHRYIFERDVRPLKDGEIVHHKNGNKQDNDASNLEALDGQAAHLHKHNYWKDKRLTAEQEEQMIDDFKEFGF